LGADVSTPVGALAAPHSPRLPPPGANISTPVIDRLAMPTRRLRARAVAGLSALLLVAVLGGCAPRSDAAVPDTSALPAPADPALPQTAATPTAQATAIPLHVPVLAFHEPNDRAHRNYCGAGATEVLLSAWTPARPDVETVARAIKVDPNSGATGADTAA